MVKEYQLSEVPVPGPCIMKKEQVPLPAPALLK
jgi:hypothetical protein